MNDLISVTYDNDRPTISGRELHEKLGIGTQYTKWFERMAEYGFIDGSDYVAISQKRLTAQGNETTFTDHQLTIDMAKQICMIQRTDEGRRYREYFLEVERKWNSPEAIMGRALKIAENKLEAAKMKVAELAPKAAYYDRVKESEGSTGIRDTAKLFGIKLGELTEFLIKYGYCYRNGKNVLMPKADKQWAGMFEVCEYMQKTPGGTYTRIYTTITPKGRAVIAARMEREKEHGDNPRA
jgi:anti-repressor protein